MRLAFDLQMSSNVRYLELKKEHPSKLISVFLQMLIITSLVYEIQPVENSMTMI